MSSSGIHVFFHLRSFQDWIEKWKNIRCKGIKLNDFSQVRCALQPQTCDSSPQNFAARNFQNIFLTAVQTVTHLNFHLFLCAVTSLPLISSFWWSSINWVPQKQPMTTLFINGHFMGLEMNSNLQRKELTAKTFFNMWCKIVEIWYGGSIDFLLDKVARASRWVWPAPS